MIIKINSANQFLLDVLHKNPNTDQGLYINPLKNGVVIGNAISANQYDVLFQDTRNSYMPDDSNAIDYQSYCSPLVVLDILTEFFPHLTRDKNDYWDKEIKWLEKSYSEIDNQSCEIEIPTFYIHSGWVKGNDFLLSKYLPQVSVSHKVGHNYKLIIKGANIFEAINLMSVVSVFTHITNRYGVFTYIDDAFSKKYARILTNIDNVPYFVFYLFIKRTVKAESQFLEVKPIFEAYLQESGIETSLTYYGTHQARIKYIVDRIDTSLPILDIGCGEFLYFKSMMRKGFFESYIAVDEDEKFELMADKISARYKNSNLEFFTNLDQVDREPKYNIILTEVIEHNTIDNAKLLIREALKFNMNQLIITTPNVEFNKYYGEDVESRHDDHDFEFTHIEFIDFIKDCMSDYNKFEVEYDHIGDKLNGVQPTQVAIISTK